MADGGGQMAEGGRTLEIIPFSEAIQKSVSKLNK
jgi:hypothetical protein